MKTLVQVYIDEISALIESVPELRGKVERSPVRAKDRNASPVITLLPGREKVEEASVATVNRHRELQVLVHTSGDEHMDVSERTFLIIHPIIMGYSADSLVLVQEIGTDDPRYRDGDLTRQVVTRRYLLTYQTADDSLSQ